MGAGRIAMTVQIKNIMNHRRLNLKWITEDNPEQVVAVKNLFHLDDTLFYTSRDVPQLLSDKDLDAVFLFTPTKTHCDLACQCLSKGKEVYVEKPAGADMDEVRRVYEHSEKSGRPLFAAFQRRFDTAYQRAVSAAHNKDIGYMQLVNLISRDNPKPSYEFLGSIGCGILTDMLVHDIDVMVWITKAQRPEFIYVVTHTHDPKMVELKEPDVIVALIKYKDGNIIRIDSARYAAYGYDMRVEIFGSDGMASVENPRLSTDVISGVHGSQMTRLNESFWGRFGEAYSKEIDHFVDCLVGKTKPRTTKEECLMTAEIIQKGLVSFYENKPVYFNLGRQ
ncbi:uncharacterized oxidoreductase YrbE-like isoform X2 [Gigantopelta aegis]|nr:uncharacterized oxidoreductase YrbE-like isoform X2 [Gigantopelta aegis]